MFVPAKPIAVSLPGKPEGAKWADPALFIDEVYYRADGAGYAKAGHNHLFHCCQRRQRGSSHRDFDHWQYQPVTMAAPYTFQQTVTVTMS